MRYVSDETRQKMSIAAKVRCQTEEFKQQVDKYFVPFCSENELRFDYENNQMSQLELCKKYFVSLKRVQTAMRRFGIKPRKPIPRNQRGSNNPSWGGDSVTYAAFHKRVEAYRGRPSECSRCGNTNSDVKYDWANLTGNYADIHDYARMCKPCHKQYDLYEAKHTAKHIPRKALRVSICA